MTDLADILCGPIVRALDSQRLLLWLVTSHNKPVKATLSVALKEVIEESVQVGTHAYLRRLTLIPKQAFENNQYIEYDIEIGGHQLQQLAPHLLYEGANCPGCVYKTQIERLLHGSCRRPHHPAADGLVRVDHELARTYHQPELRPALLLHSGDQVYVDDVAGPMLQAIHQIIERLELFDEVIEGAPIESSFALRQHQKNFYRRDALLPDTEVNAAITKRFFGGVRKPIFTSSNAANHLITLNEMIAMYLLSWSPTPWKMVNLYAPASLAAKQLNRFNQELTNIDDFSCNLAQVARAMANIPNYMIFDDHDITDDWNLSALWEESAYQHPFSKRIVGNALIGYLLCQAWGNTTDKVDELIKQVNSIRVNAGTYDSAEQDALIEELLTFEDWGYTIARTPAVIVLDTRTQRWRSEKSRAKPSGLMDWEALTSFQSKIIDHTAVIVVSPAPMFGVKLIEAIQEVFTLFGKPLLVDAENWMAHQGSAEVMLNIFSHRKTPQHFTILSGDVHYSFVYDVAIKHLKQSPEICQITSSGIKNQFPDSLLEWLDRLNRWLFAPYSPLNWFTKRRRFRVFPRLPSERSAGERLWNQAGIGFVEFSDDGTPKHIKQLNATGGECTFEPSHRAKGAEP